MTPFLETRGVSKTFPGVRALNNVDLQVRLGEVHALAGEKGAGKSTLIEILTGVFKANPGGTLLLDEPVIIEDSIHARALGISIIYQELSMVENLTVAENIFLPREELRPTGSLDKARMNREAAEVLATLEMTIDPATPVARLSIGQKQMIEIAKAVAYRSQLIIMDEPTASLSHHEAVTLLGLIRKLREQGIGIDGKPVTIREPADAIAHGIGFVTEDRKGQGLVLGMTVRENFSLTHLEAYSPRQFVDRRKETSRCLTFVKSLGIKTPSAEQRVVNLSGGIQQKIVIAKWVARSPKILIVDEPTRGIDIGAKAEVHALLARLASERMGVIVISSDLPEVLAVSDRVVVIRDGRISRVLDRADATQETIMQAAAA